MKKSTLILPLFLFLLTGCNFLKHQARNVRDKIWESTHKTEIVLTAAEAEVCLDCERLQFKIVQWVPDPNGKESRKVPNEKKPEESQTENGRFADPNAPFLTGRSIRELSLRRGEYPFDYEIYFKFGEEGKNILKNVTALNLKNYVRISINDAVLSTPVIREPISQGEVVLTYGSSDENVVKEVFEKIRKALESQTKVKPSAAFVGRLPDEVSGTCGCFAWEGADRAKGKLIYREDLKEKNLPQMNLAGKIVDLQKPSPPSRGKYRSVTQGDWMEEILSGGGSEIKSHWTAIEINSPADDSARTVNFNVRFSVQHAGQTQTIGATGYCGC